MLTLVFSHIIQVIDGGSTGSRLHIFEFFEDTCIRRGSARAHVPLSAFGRTPSNAHEPLNATHVADHLMPLFEYAADVIPNEYHATTGVKYQATAGMRLLDVDEQEAVYDALYTGLMESETFVFRSTTRQDIATLSGDLEGFYGAVAANYLKGIIDVKLNTIGGEDNHHGPLGALDMGGSSTQIVYLPKTNPCENEEACHDEMELPSKLNGGDFFSTSYLAYGVDQFRERLWDTWVERQQQQEKEYQDACGDKYIDNPCGFKGYELEWKGYILLGTGDTAECVKQVQQLIPHDDKVHNDTILPGNKVGGVEHPPLRGKFYAMSLYYFSLDSLRVLSHPHAEAHEALNLSWPTPSIEELFNALDGLCSRSWQGDLEEIQHDAHDFTRAEVLPHRCIESVYMVTLLRDGFGFHPSSRDITFSFLVDGSEVEWSLGMALALHAEEHDATYESKQAYNAFVESHVYYEESNATYDDACEAQTCPSALALGNEDSTMKS